MFSELNLIRGFPVVTFLKNIYREGKSGGSIGLVYSIGKNPNSLKSEYFVYMYDTQYTENKHKKIVRP
jgi:hypothetical protein